MYTFLPSSGQTTGVELEIIELSQKRLHDPIDVLLKAVNLVGLVVGLQVSHDSLHVVLQIVHVIRLLSEASLHQSVVENQIDSGLHRLFCALSGLLSTGVGADIKIFSDLSLDMLAREVRFRL